MGKVHSFHWVAYIFRFFPSSKRPESALQLGRRLRHIRFDSLFAPRKYKVQTAVRSTNAGHFTIEVLFLFMNADAKLLLEDV
jgi:hypothetical protein